MQPGLTRTLETCPHRGQVRVVDSVELAECALLSSISGVRDPRLIEVAGPACEACCLSFQPTREDLNPVVASSLFNLTEQVMANGGVEGCSLEHATELNRWAERSLPAVDPDEDDDVDIARQVSLDYGNVTLEQIAKLLPPPNSQPVRRIDRWMVGITTAPRRMSTLEQCLQSIRCSGWEQSRLFVDGSVDLPVSAQEHDFTARDQPTGAFPNYVLALYEMYLRDPDANAYLLLQDDAVLFASPELKTYLESVLWPEAGPCIASLYCSSKYTRQQAGWHRFQEQWVWGAVAFVFSSEALRHFLTSPLVYDHRALPDQKGLSHIDVVIGKVAQENRIPLYYPSPSLVQHIGTISTIWNTGRAAGSRRADCFIGDLLPKPESEAT